MYRISVGLIKPSSGLMPRSSADICSFTCSKSCCQKIPYNIPGVYGIKTQSPFARVSALYSASHPLLGMETSMRDDVSSVAASHLTYVSLGRFIKGGEVRNYKHSIYSVLSTS
ncbi:hypothetical protein FKM82_029326 [Ascaphus truei]